MKKYEMLKINVDAGSIAIGILGMMTADEHTALSIGMLPGCKMQLCRDMIAEKLCKEREYHDLDEDRKYLPHDDDGTPDFDGAVDFTPREVIDEIVNDISQAIYAKASMVA